MISRLSFTAAVFRMRHFIGASTKKFIPLILRESLGHNSRGINSGISGSDAEDGWLTSSCSSCQVITPSRRTDLNAVVARGGTE